MLRRRYPLVRLHMVPPPAQEGVADRGEPSLEGILTGRWQGHYVLEQARLLLGEETISLSGRQYVDKAQVVFIQELERVRLGGAR